MRASGLIHSSVAALLCLVPPSAALAQGLPPGDAKTTGFDPARLQRIETMFKASVDQGQIAGAVALVARNGKVVYITTVGQADREAGKPMQPNTIFRIASMTKPVTSVAVMMLQEEGKLKTSDPVSKFLPEFAEMMVLVPRDPDAPKTDAPFNVVPAEREVTIHDLLTHTSGLTYRFANKPGLGKMYEEAGVWDGLAETSGTTRDNARKLAKLPLLFQPGSNWEYSLGTDVLGAVVEVASGQTLDAFCRERVFKPLRMEDTYFVLPPEKADRLAAVYTPGKPGERVKRVGGEVVKVGPLVYSATYPNNQRNAYFSGGAGLVSTAGDYARFLQMLLNGGELDGTRILKRETVDLMTRHRLGDKMHAPSWGHGTDFGYGFGIVREADKKSADDDKPGDPAGVGTFSWGGFFYTYFWADPQRQVIGVMMTQLQPSGPLKLREEFKRLVYEAMMAESG